MAVAVAVARALDALDALDSTDRAAALHFGLAPCWVQAAGRHDAEAVRHLDRADGLAPQRTLR